MLLKKQHAHKDLNQHQECPVLPVLARESHNRANKDRGCQTRQRVQSPVGQLN
jgi:hypothetical protein